MLADVPSFKVPQVMNIKRYNKFTGRKSKYIYKRTANSPAVSVRLRYTVSESGTLLHSGFHKAKCKGKDGTEIRKQEYHLKSNSIDAE